MYFIHFNSLIDSSQQLIIVLVLGIQRNRLGDIHLGIEEA
jgi:hypothetical protein